MSFNTLNPNTARFWDKKIDKEQGKLKMSPIYKDKNKIITNYLSNKSGNILDIGFGYGDLEKSLIKNGSTLNLYGIDISPIAVRNIKKSIIGNFVLGNALKIPFNGTRFNFITALDIFEHFYSNQQSLLINQVSSKIEKGGTFIMSVPLNESLEGKKMNKHLTTFNESNLLNLLVEKDFVIENIVFLYAFRRFYWLKSWLMKYLRVKEPNLLIVFATKK